jgi:hypothetical protein
MIVLKERIFVGHLERASRVVLLGFAEKSLVSTKGVGLCKMSEMHL